MYLQNQNVRYALNAVRVAKRFGCKKFIGIGSQTEYGRIVNMASVWSVISKEKWITCNDSNTGLFGLTIVAAIELGRKNVLVNAIPRDL